jgi:hypothetical protein
LPAQPRCITCVHRWCMPSYIIIHRTRPKHLKHLPDCSDKHSKTILTVMAFIVPESENSSSGAFEHLLSPCTSSDFFRHFWQRKCHFLIPPYSRLFPHHLIVLFSASAGLSIFFDIRPPISTAFSTPSFIHSSYLTPLCLKARATCCTSSCRNNSATPIHSLHFVATLRLLSIEPTSFRRNCTLCAQAFRMWWGDDAPSSSARLSLL